MHTTDATPLSGDTASGLSWPRDEQGTKGGRPRGWGKRGKVRESERKREREREREEEREREVY
jgi:hypothetical protein